ncbi:MAG: glycoside hydrolase family 43 protein [Acidobacteria bacterium]|nr:glycoside hydrolase family 43 protein [Acidobacteriota bacterium]
MKRLGFALILLCSALFAATYTNPIGDPPIRIGDPFVLQAEGAYYLFGTTARDGFLVQKSTDLVHWQPLGYAWKMTSEPWADGVFWAPEVKFYRGKYYMTYSGRMRGATPARLLTAIAVSDKPEGPYKDLHAPWFDAGYSAIDSDLFVDSDGTPYLYFSRNGARDGYAYGIVYGVEVARDLSKIIGEPVKLLEADQPWEKINWAHNRCNEGPTVLKHKGRYYMTYSANNTGAPGYGVGVATASKPLGPWVKYTDNPILASKLDIGVSSPGHNSITFSPDKKEMFIVYHTHADPGKPAGARVLNIDRLVFDKADRLKVVGPTRSPQPMPSGAR